MNNKKTFLSFLKKNIVIISFVFLFLFIVCLFIISKISKSNLNNVLDTLFRILLGGLAFSIWGLLFIVPLVYLSICAIKLKDPNPILRDKLNKQSFNFLTKIFLITVIVSPYFLVIVINVLRIIIKLFDDSASIYLYYSVELHLIFMPLLSFTFLLFFGLRKLMFRLRQGILRALVIVIYIGLYINLWFWSGFVIIWSGFYEFDWSIFPRDNYFTIFTIFFLYLLLIFLICFIPWLIQRKKISRPINNKQDTYINFSLLYKKMMNYFPISVGLVLYLIFFILYLLSMYTTKYVFLSSAEYIFFCLLGSSGFSLRTFLSIFVFFWPMVFLIYLYLKYKFKKNEQDVQSQLSKQSSYFLLILFIINFIWSLPFLNLLAVNTGIVLFDGIETTGMSYYELLGSSSDLTIHPISILITYGLLFFLKNLFFKLKQKKSKIIVFTSICLIYSFFLIVGGSSLNALLELRTKYKYGFNLKADLITPIFLIYLAILILFIFFTLLIIRKKYPKKQISNLSDSKQHHIQIIVDDVLIKDLNISDETKLDLSITTKEDNTTNIDTSIVGEE